MDNLSIIEATNDLEDSIDGTDVRQESVTETGTGGGTTGQTGDIIDGQVGGNLRLGLVVLAKPVEAVIGDNDTRLFGVNGSIGEVGRVTKGRLGNGLEERGLADVGETNLERREETLLKSLLEQLHCVCGMCREEKRKKEKEKGKGRYL